MAKIEYFACDNCGKPADKHNQLRTIQVKVCRGGELNNSYTNNFCSAKDLCEDCCPKFGVTYDNTTDNLWEKHRVQQPEGPTILDLIEERLSDMISDALNDLNL